GLDGVKIRPAHAVERAGDLEPRGVRDTHPVRHGYARGDRATLRAPGDPGDLVLHPFWGIALRLEQLPTRDTHDRADVRERGSRRDGDKARNRESEGGHAATQPSHTGHS